MNEALIRDLLRLTARITFVFTLAAFTGPALRGLWSTSLSGWVACKRDWFLLGQAGSHTLHLVLIFILIQSHGWSRREIFTLVAGGSVYVLIYLLAVNALGRLKSGRDGYRIGAARFEAVALYVIWLVFATAFVPRISKGPLVYSVLGVAALAGLSIRLAYRILYSRSKPAFG